MSCDAMESTTAVFTPSGGIFKDACIPHTRSPSRWEHELNSSLAWTGADLTDASVYTTVLTPQDVEEIEQALTTFKSHGLGGSEITRSNFPLPRLAGILCGLALELHKGRGFFVLRGLDPLKYTAEDNTLIFLGISSYIGQKRGRQNGDGDMFSHVRESKSACEAQRDRPPKYSNLALSFHTDGFSDIIAMQTRSCGAAGGRLMLASTWNVCRKAAVMVPEVLDILARPHWKFHADTPHSAVGQQSLLYRHGGRWILHYVREPLLGFDEKCRTQIETFACDAQIEALDVIERIAQQDKLVLSPRPGDLTFVNNFALLHAREAFEDDAASTRHMVRMWLKNESLAWKLPKVLRNGNDAVFEHAADERNWNILPSPRLKYQLAELFSP